MNKIIKIIYWLILLLGILIAIYISLYSENQGFVSLNNSVSLSSINVCEISNDTQKNIQKTIKICGIVDTEKEPIPLRIYIYRMPEKVLVAENHQDDLFHNGNFIREFTFENNEGLYKIVIYFYRSIVGEVEFSIQE